MKRLALLLLAFSFTQELEVEGDLKVEGSVIYSDNSEQNTAAVASPIGSIIAWAKNLEGVPELANGWAECNGQTVEDELSPLNGTVLPNLNGENRFLRGESQSGNSGGQSSVQVELDEFDNNTKRLWALSASYLKYQTTSGTYTAGIRYTKPISTIPPYYEVVWIMRIK